MNLQKLTVLLVEDDEYKAKQIIDFLNWVYPNEILIIQKRSYQSGVREIISNKFDFILLDMSMPAFDRTPHELSTNFRHFAGRDVLLELKRRKIKVNTIVVTQFDIFGEGTKRIDASDLDKLLKDEFPLIYRGMIHYNASLSSWKTELITLINKIIGE